MRGLAFVCFCAVSLSCFAQSFDGEARVFFQLLKEFEKYPNLSKELDAAEKKKFQEVTLDRLKNLPKKSLEARFTQYNLDYTQYVNLQNKVARELKTREAVLDRTPITAKERTYVETTVQAQRDKLQQIRRYLFYASVNANRSILSSLKTFDGKTDKSSIAASGGDGSSSGSSASDSAAPLAPPPKMPGVYGGSREERLRQSESEKINLTPVDAEFYATELGQKLENDLGGRADYWSYDYDKDELYLKVGSDMGKLSVKEDGPGVRFVQTKAGAGMMEPKGSALKVDLYKARGRFLTGDLNEETLFGPMPQKGEDLLDEDDVRKGRYHPPKKTIQHRRGR
jgi:hypothetical protein